MKSRIKVLGHPVHPMLIVFPLGLLAMSFIFDIIYLASDDGRSFALTSYYMISAGIIGGLVAAVFGTIDWLGLPRDSRAWKVGLIHGAGNALVVLLFFFSWLVRRNNGYMDPGIAPVILSFVGVSVAMFAGWLGGELVYRLNVGVDPGADINAPSSLSTDPAAEFNRRGVVPPGGAAKPISTRTSEPTSFPGR